MRVLVTGAAGFIGFHTAKALLARGDEVIGLDNLNAYYDVRLKQARLAQLEAMSGFSFARIDLADRQAMADLFERQRPQRVVSLAAQAGVRYSIENPHTYVEANVVGFLNVLEGCRNTSVEHLVFASTSSVYGANAQLPFTVAQSVDHPISLYAATKKANELMAHTYAHLYRLPVTGLRFFTVYGPWGRPDMALFKFTKAILEGRSIEIYNNGHHARDFTYVDDVVEGVLRTLDLIAAPNPAWSALAPEPASSSAPYRIYNIGNNKPVELMHLIALLEREIGRAAIKTFLPLQQGDVAATFADVDDLIRDTGFRPDTPIEVGVAKFVEWYRAYHGLNAA
jgi:UDP-glucuronate 4-epimerase